MTFQPLIPGVEISGLAVHLTMTSFRILPSIVLRYYVKHGFLKDTDDQIDLQSFYSQAAWLNVFADIYCLVGPNATAEMGRQIGGLYPIPPEINEIEPLLRYLDIGYHLSHRFRGQPMYDPATGKFTDGIGHYALHMDAGLHSAKMICDTPYPCDLDIGLVEALARRKAPRAQIDHVPGRCRKDGDSACIYSIRW